MAGRERAGTRRAGRFGATAFFASRWKGEAPLPTLFWRDMVVVGTAINMAATLAALALLGAGAPLALVIGLHVLVLPYNLFLFVAVWRSSGQAGGWPAQAAPLAATLWLIAVTLA